MLCFRRLDAMTSTIKILHAFSSFAIGGSQMRFAVLANALAARYAHDIFAMDNDFATPFILSYIVL